MINTRQMLNGYKHRRPTDFPIYSIAILLLLLVSPVMAGKPNCDDPNSTHPSCNDDGGGGTGEIPLVCSLSDDRAVDGDTLLDDGLGEYTDGMDNVDCKTFAAASSWPNLAKIVLQAAQGNSKGKKKLAARKLDLALRHCDDVDPFNCIDAADEFLPPSIFQSGYDGEVWTYSEMEYIYIEIRPYSDQPDIPSLGPGYVYPMALFIASQGLEPRFRLNLASRVVADTPGEGVYCNDLEAATTTDVNVYVWPDIDDDGVPDGYTVTTGTFDTDYLPTTLTPGPMRATICTNEGLIDCTAQVSVDGFCNYQGQVDMQFTFDAWIR